jgi:hypothetical protein
MDFKSLLNLASLAVVVLYAYFVFVGHAPSNLYLLADGLAGSVLLYLVVKGNRAFNVLVSLVWLVANYVMKFEKSHPLWLAYDGFALASFASMVKV